MKKAKQIRIFSIIILVLVMVIGGLVYTSSIQRAIVGEDSTESTEAKEAKVIAYLVEKWKTIAPAQIPNYPAANVAFYGYPYRIQFIGNHKVLLAYQDDFNPFVALFSYTEDGNFTYMTQQMIDTLKPSRWQEWVTMYGSPTAGLHSYQFSSKREGDKVYPSDWVKVSSTTNDF